MQTSNPYIKSSSIHQLFSHFQHKDEGSINCGHQFCQSYEENTNRVNQDFIDFAIETY